MEVKASELDIPEYLKEMLVHDLHRLQMHIEYLEEKKEQAIQNLIDGNLTGANHEEAKLRIEYYRSYLRAYTSLLDEYKRIKAQNFTNQVMQ